ncbi:MAG: hypothetical protein Fur002_12260 [Anaerolineales bacterium]
MTDLLRFKKIRLPSYAADLLSFLGIGVYLAQLIRFAYTTISNLDEGSYLLRGYLFASGAYRPFQEGMYTGKMPLAFLIPGYAQLWFGAGLRTGRWLSVLFGALALILLWHTARRLSDSWLAAAAVWTLALSPTVIKYYSGAATQATIAFFLSAALALILGADRKLWQLALGGLLAGTMVVTRENMVAVFPLFALYVLWQHGWRGAWMFFLPGAAVIGAIHIIYFPEILRLWYWLPFVHIPAEFRYSGGGGKRVINWVDEIFLASRFLSVFQALRVHFIALTGAFFSALLFPPYKRWKASADFKVFLTLLALFFGLLYMHYSASIGKNYCVFCLSPYIAFFNVSGILLTVVSIRLWNRQPHVAVQPLLFLIFLLAFTGVGFSLFERVGAGLMNLPAPRVSGAGFSPGWTTWGALLAGGLNLPANISKQSLSAAAGFTVGVMALGGAFLFWKKSVARAAMNFAAFSAFTLMALGLLSSAWLHGNALDCNVNIIANNEQNGEHFRKIIPAGKSVYWDGGLSAAPLLYLPNRVFFPAQFNSGYTFFSGAETAQTVKFGFWNEELDAQWKASADFFLVSVENYNNKDWKEFFSDARFDEFPRAPKPTACAPESRLRIFRRK